VSLRTVRSPSLITYSGMQLTQALWSQ